MLAYAAFPHGADNNNARRKPLVVLLVLSFPELRACAAVLDVDRPFHVCDLFAARLPELHLSLVSPSDRLVDASRRLHYAVDHATADACSGRGVLGGDGASCVLHGHVQVRFDATPGAITPCSIEIPFSCSCSSYAR